jgi:ABC-2 type transport system ATP-binding protein
MYALRLPPGEAECEKLSGGEKRRVALCRLLLEKPDLLILDEPFSGLDPVNVELLKEIVLELKTAGNTIIFSTHQMEVAEKICDDICLINRSQKVLEGSLREVKQGFGRNSVSLNRVNQISIRLSMSLPETFLSSAKNLS